MQDNPRHSELGKRDKKYKPTERRESEEADLYTEQQESEETELYSEQQESEETELYSEQQESEEEGPNPEPPGGSEESEQQPVKRKNKHVFWIGIIALVLTSYGLFFDRDKIEFVDSQTGIGMAAGTTLANFDSDVDMEPRNFTVKMKEGKTTSRMLIWDFAAEDGDIVTVKVDGNIIAENVGLLRKPAAIDIPVPSVVEIVGVKDGVGGITYGVKFPGEIANHTYFNVAPEGSANVYTITGP
ncbi:hypothetical protein NDK47_26930 [Brevibacillus ruminantium]|uniref:Uncharacterized protein n=1 Tax=Brevibacillus ruminantium TaxID=2950604 RepID=A0ABY4WEV6_9BACL|nr:hypothetical protein [Brevibacillus ruminantium]USG65690.1 hypothetical protein NDK47_26930 [Brevibacillus ruminantium]